MRKDYTKNEWLQSDETQNAIPANKNPTDNPKTKPTELQIDKISKLTAPQKDESPIWQKPRRQKPNRKPTETNANQNESDPSSPEVIVFTRVRL